MVKVDIGQPPLSAKPRPLDHNLLPAPVFDADPGMVDFYWKAWDYAWAHVITRPDIPQSPYIDCAFTPGGGKTIWIWDSCFMALYCKYAPHIFPGIETLENFYKIIHDRVKTPFKIEHPDNPPLFAWAEWETFRMTGNMERLRQVIIEKRYLQKHYDYLEHAKRWRWKRYARNPLFAQRHPLGFQWSGVASGMDNTLRGQGERRHMLWVDLLAQQGLSAEYIAKIATVLGDMTITSNFQAHYAAIKNLLNTRYWDEEDGIYYDIRVNPPHAFVKVKTPAAFWPMLAGICDQRQAEQLAAKVEDPNCFGGEVPWPSVARDDPAFNPKGKYWQGGVWLPTAYMGTKALERYGFYAVADRAAAKLLRHMLRTYQEWDPHTIWELFSPTAPEPGTTGNGVSRARPDFCGWSALGPVSLLIENMLGFRSMDAIERKITWNPPLKGRSGIRGLRLGPIVVDLIHEDGRLEVATSGNLSIEMKGRVYVVQKGSQVLSLN